MDKRSLWFILPLLLLGGDAWWLSAQAPINPVVSAPTITPGIVVINTPTLVTATVSIPDPTLNPSHVTLLRVAPDGTSSVVASMVDNGQNGDKKPGDRVFTAQFTLNETSPKTFAFQVSAVFRGQNKTLSAVQQFAALAPTTLPVVLPPDPGEAGKTTLAGIDSDGDGVRDDVERSIIFSAPESARHREALKQQAIAIQRSILSQTYDQSYQSFIARMRAIDCLSFVGKLADNQWKGILALMLNTKARLQANELSKSQVNGQVFHVLDLDQKYAACGFDAESLPN
jgi:hypothetical protein